MTNRDLDAEIAEKIYGWKPVPVSSDANGEKACEILYPPNKKPDQDFYNALPRVGKINRGWWAPRYSSDLIEAVNLCKFIRMPISVIDMPTDPEKLSKMAFDFWKVNKWRGE